MKPSSPLSRIHDSLKNGGQGQRFAVSCCVCSDMTCVPKFVSISNCYLNGRRITVNVPKAPSIWNYLKWKENTSYTAKTLTDSMSRSGAYAKIGFSFFERSLRPPFDLFVPEYERRFLFVPSKR